MSVFPFFIKGEHPSREHIDHQKDQVDHAQNVQESHIEIGQLSLHEGMKIPRQTPKAARRDHEVYRIDHNVQFPGDHRYMAI